MVLDPGQQEDLSFAQDILVSGTTQVVGSLLNLMAVARPKRATSPTRGEERVTLQTAQHIPPTP
jgi:hypothetical protein